MIKYAISLLVLKSIDIATTYYVLSRVGIESELNPIVKWTMECFGLELALCLNVLVFSWIFLAMCIFTTHYNRKLVFVLSILIYSCVAINNLYGVFLV